MGFLKRTIFARSTKVSFKLGVDRFLICNEFQFVTTCWLFLRSSADSALLGQCPFNVYWMQKRKTTNNKQGEKENTTNNKQGEKGKNKRLTEDHEKRTYIRERERKREPNQYIYIYRLVITRNRDGMNR